MPARDVQASPTRFAQALFSGLPARYDRLAALLSLGQDGRWRREMIDHIVPAHPARVLDVATGPAGVAIQLAARTDAVIVGVDISADMLGRGQTNVREAGLADRITLVLGKGEQLPFADGSFDALTFTYLLRYVADPVSTLAELARVVRAGGPAASLEFAVPTNPFWRFWWRGYTRLVLPVAGGLLGGRPWFEVGRFLGPNIDAHYRRCPAAATVEAWTAAGFVDVQLRRMSLGGGVVMWGRRAS
jgi:demethylmenaquinone methyltransferase/2-methoxy-6-polyprenyl-1,4-benzoquinol methylase